jgi:hypothetical protein
MNSHLTLRLKTLPPPGELGTFTCPALERFQKQSTASKTKIEAETYTVLAIKKATPQKNVRFFSNFSWWFKMLPSLFELLNQLHKKPAQLGKGIKKATRAHRPLSKDLNLSKKNRFF